MIPPEANSLTIEELVGFKVNLLASQVRRSGRFRVAHRFRVCVIPSLSFDTLFSGGKGAFS